MKDDEDFRAYKKAEKYKKCIQAFRQETCRGGITWET
jgi:hypothetical protein